MQIKITNISDGVVEVDWDPSTLPPSAQQIQFRSISNVSPGGAGVGFDVISTSQSLKSGKARLNNPQIIKSGVLLQLCVAAITGAGPEYGYTDIEGSNVVAIVPL